jgi:DNA-binding protein YbaB
MSDLSNVLGDLDRLMESAQREAQAAAQRQQNAVGEGTGTALDGKIAVRLAPDGRVSELRLDDQVMGLEAHELAREIVSALNEAWATARSSDPAAAAAAAVDPAALADRLRQVREESMQSMRAITDSLAAVMTKIDQRVQNT